MHFLYTFEPYFSNAEHITIAVLLWELDAIYSLIDHFYLELVQYWHMEQLLRKKLRYIGEGVVYA